MATEDQTYASLAMDRGLPLGNSLDSLGRRALHTKVTNLLTEPIPVFVTEAPAINLSTFPVFNSVTSIPSATPTVVTTYTVPVGKQGALLNALVSGSNIGYYELLLNSSTIATTRTMFGTDLSREIPMSGIALTAGDQIDIQVTHPRPTLGDFEATLIIRTEDV